MNIFHWKNRSKKNQSAPDLVHGLEGETNTHKLVKPVEYEFAPHDPFLHHLVNASGVVSLDNLELDSPALEFLRNVGVKVCVPLVSQGELIGLLNLGPRLSEQAYSRDDFRLLNALATQAAPALRVAQLAQQQQIEARERERMEQELRVARIIQETLLPKELPQIENWYISAYWKPAREVSGDFYDFIAFPDGRLGIVIGDVSGKGVPAALVMATTRSILHGAAERLISPSAVLERANDLLNPDIPPNMFVTCLYILLDPERGEITYANAGHNLPQKCTWQTTSELRATGMPLGLLPNMTYEEKHARLFPGESLVLYSDGLVEAHNQQGEMFGFPRLRQIITENSQCGDLTRLLIENLNHFTGSDWEQEDDVTLVNVKYLETNPPALDMDSLVDGAIRLAEFSLPSEPGNERWAMNRVAEIVLGADFPVERIESLKTAVAESTLNAIEHGNHYQPELPVTMQVIKIQDEFRIYITDQGGNVPIPEHTEPDLEAKLAGLQSPRGWGLFLIQKTVDEMKIHVDSTHHTLELVFRHAPTPEKTGDKNI